MEVADVNRRLLGQFPLGEYSTGMLPTSAVDVVTVKAEQGPTQQEYDRALSLECNDNTGGAPIETGSVLDKLHSLNWW